MGFNPLLQKPFEILVTSVTCFVRLYLLLPLTLRELVSMHQCSSLPLDSVVRILSSKFWKIESDIWADLLIICRWANPTTTIHTKDVTCTLCDGVWNDPATIANCGHTFCRKCLTTAISQCKDCPVCGVQIMYIMPHNREAKRLVELYYQERQVTLEDLQSTCEKFGINFCELQSDNDTLQPQVITVTRGKRQTEELFTSSSPKRKCTVPAQAVAAPLVYTRIDLPEVLEALFRARTKWFFLGLALGLPKDILDSIEAKHHSDLERCLTETIDSRLKTGKPLTSEDIVQALKKPTVGYTDLATELQDVQQMHAS